MIAAATLTSATAAAAAPDALFQHFRYAGAQPAGRDLPVRRGEFRNPILAGSYSDPAIVRVGPDYYLANSSFTLFPGAPIFRSRDLVHWRQVGSAIERPSQLDFTGLDTWQGDYANDLKFRDGRFYLLGACYGCGGPFLMTAAKASGPWSDPVWLPLDGIDPSIFFDDDGRAYLLDSGSPPGGARYPGHRAIWMQELDLQALTLIGPRTVLVDGGSRPERAPFWLEGPHLLKHDGRYVLICAEGGTKERHTEVAFRADALRGPYLSDSANPILSQLDLDPARPGRVTQVGHADVVRTPAGDWWAVFLGSRPWGPGELDYDTGRETFLLPVRWEDGWPRILPPGVPVSPVAPRPKLPPAPTGEPHGGDFAFVDDFAAPTLAPQWSTVGTPRSVWWRTGGGSLRVEARPDALGGPGQPSFLGVRQQHRDAVTSVEVRFDPQRLGGRAGLAAFQGMRRFFALSVAATASGGREVRLERVAGKDDPPTGALMAAAPLPAATTGAVGLRISLHGPRIAFSYRLQDGRWRPIGVERDGSALATSSSGGFTGVMLGVYAYAPPP